MAKLIPIEEFIREAEKSVVLDVRSPGEFQQGHIPGAVSFPLFSDAERAEVGTLYKQKGPDAAMLRGLEFVGPKMAEFVREARRISPTRKVAIHCWRGGKRSKSMAWLLESAGMEAVVLEGGYKAYRHWVLEFGPLESLDFCIIGGKTGTGKTKILRALRNLGEQIIDLEAMANHKGSAFGAIGEAPQPTAEHFENGLFEVLRSLDPTRRVWLENESRSIGKVFIPDIFWAKMKHAPLINVEIPMEDRIQNLLDDYAPYPVSDLASAFEKIDRKLGGVQFKKAIEALEAGDLATAAEIALWYYDKTYQHCLDNNISPKIHFLPVQKFFPENIAKSCIYMANTY